MSRMSARFVGHAVGMSTKLGVWNVEGYGLGRKGQVR